ncbi:hypothetical protein DFH09DRAFT_1093197 [Mycena vulgaris]|nr:hypothetical protein DFH09DRAFT_1093197 [Mycena vulgaris]
MPDGRILISAVNTKLVGTVSGPSQKKPSSAKTLFPMSNVPKIAFRRRIQKRSNSILPENLIDCARIYDFYTNGISEGNYSHQAHVALVDVLGPAGETAQRSAPSLMDLLHEENVAPSAVDKEALSELLFNHPDPYGLAETDRLDAGRTPVQRSTTTFDIAEYIKLDSPALATLMQPPKEPGPQADTPMPAPGGPKPGCVEKWSIDDFLK